MVSAVEDVIEGDDIVAEATGLARQREMIHYREISLREIGYGSAAAVGDDDEEVRRLRISRRRESLAGFNLNSQPCARQLCLTLPGFANHATEASVSPITTAENNLMLVRTKRASSLVSFINGLLILFLERASDQEVALLANSPQRQ